MDHVPSICFAFDPAKAAESGAHLLHRAGGRMKYLRLLKLLYLADRKCLDLFDRPIVGDSYVSMAKGPVLSAVYDAIKNDKDASPKDAWHERIRREDAHHVALALPWSPSTSPDRLSTAELNILDAVSDEHATKSEWELCEFTHSLGEWVDPGTSSLRIDPNAILAALGKTAEAKAHVRDCALMAMHASQLFHGPQVSE